VTQIKKVTNNNNNNNNNNNRLKFIKVQRISITVCQKFGSNAESASQYNFSN